MHGGRRGNYVSLNGVARGEHDGASKVWEEICDTHREDVSDIITTADTFSSDESVWWQNIYHFLKLFGVRLKAYY